MKPILLLFVLFCTSLLSSDARSHRVRAENRHPLPINCEDCGLDPEEPDPIPVDAVSPEERIEWGKHTGERAANILNMLDKIDSTPEANHIETHTKSRIVESLHLLGLYDVLKRRMLKVLHKAGVSIKLPSEQSYTVDATGKRWEDAEQKDDVDYLFRRMQKSYESDHELDDIHRLGFGVSQENERANDGPPGLFPVKEGMVPAQTVDHLPSNSNSIRIVKPTGSSSTPAPLPSDRDSALAAAIPEPFPQRPSGVHAAPEVEEGDAEGMLGFGPDDCLPPLCQTNASSAQI